MVARSLTASQPRDLAPASQYEPTKYISILSVTPPFPDGMTSPNPRDLRDTRDSESFSEDATCEEEREVMANRQSSGAYCAPDSDSDDDLADLDTLLRLFKAKPNPSSLHKDGKRNLMRDPHDASPESSNPLKKDYKYSLKKLVSDNKSEAEHQQHINEARTKLNAAEANSERAKVAGALSDSAELGMLAALADREPDEDRAAKLRLALDRQELLTSDADWRFFGRPNAGNDSVLPDFPNLDGHILEKLADPDFREDAFLTGFASDWLSSMNTLPEEMIVWLWQAAIYEPRDDLRAAFRSTLTGLCKHVCDNLNTDYINRPLEAMCAEKEAMEPTRPLAHFMRPTKQAPPKPPNQLTPFLEATHCISNTLPVILLPYTVSLFLRMAIDRSVSEDRHNHQLLRAILANLIESAPHEQPLGSLGDALVSFVPLPALQKRILAVLSDVSPKQCRFKRRLALSFFLRDSTHLAQPLDDAQSITQSVAAHICTHSAFDIFDKRIDYRDLTASVTIIDVSVSTGFGSPQVLVNDARAAATEAVKTVEKEFNGQVDVLSGAINTLYTRIQDTGASHMLRTTAKSTIQNLALRLDYGVRTTPRPRRDVLGNATIFQRPLKFSSGAMPLKRRISLGDDCGRNSRKEKPAKLRQQSPDRTLWKQEAPTVRSARSDNQVNPRANDVPGSVIDTDSELQSSNAKRGLPTSSVQGHPSSTQVKPELRKSTHAKFMEHKKRVGLKSPLSGLASEGGRKYWAVDIYLHT